MIRVVVIAVLLAGCSKEEPKPDPLGACKKTLATYDKVRDVFAGLVGAAPDIGVDAFCGKLQVATKGAAFAGGGNQYVGPVLTKLDEVASKCATQGLEATRTALKDTLAKGRVQIEKMCK